MWLLGNEPQTSVKVQMVLASTGFWSMLFILACLSIRLPSLPAKSLWDIRNRVVSAAHGTFAYYLSIYALTYWREFGLSNTFLETIIISVTLGYFLYDTGCMLMLSVFDFFIMLHHCAVIVGLTAALCTDMGGAEISWGYFITEGSNAFLHAKEITRALGMKDTKMYIFSELGFFATYYFGRFVVGVPGVFMIVTSGNTPLLVRSVCFLLEVQSFEWGYRMLKIMRKRYSEWQNRTKKGISLQWFAPLKA